MSTYGVKYACYNPKPCTFLFEDFCLYRLPEQCVGVFTVKTIVFSGWWGCPTDFAQRQKAPSDVVCCPSLNPMLTKISARANNLSYYREQSVLCSTLSHMPFASIFYSME